MVIVYGRYNSDEMAFMVSELTLPPLEKRKETISFSGQQHHVFENQLFQNMEQCRRRRLRQQQQQHVNNSGTSISDSQLSTFSSSDSHTLTLTSDYREYSERLQKTESSEHGGHSAFMVILSDVWLDKPTVLEKLKTLFSGFQDNPPACFVLMGNFMSRPFQFGMQQNDRELYRKGFDRLADIIKQFPAYISGETKFIFVPGPQDPGIGNVLPRPCVPDLFVRNMRDRIGHSNVLFTSNPTRIRFFSREIVLFREDLQQKMRRNCLVAPQNESNDEDDGKDDVPLHEQVVHSVISNYHLCPLPLTVSPIVWKQDHVMRLFPLPDALILADKCELFELPDKDQPRQQVQLEGYPQCLNPSSFPIDFSFLCFHPVQNRVEWLKIPQ